MSGPGVAGPRSAGVVAFSVLQIIIGAALVIAGVLFAIATRSDGADTGELAEVIMRPTGSVDASTRTMRPPMSMESQVTALSALPGAHQLLGGEQAVAGVA